MGKKNNLRWGILLVATLWQAKNSLIHIEFTKVQNKSLVFFGLKIGWKSNLLTKTRSIYNSARWLKQSCPIVLLRFAFSLHKTLNDCSAF